MFQSAVQAAFNDHQTGESGDNDFGSGIDMNDLAGSAVPGSDTVRRLSDRERLIFSDEIQ